MQSERLHLNSCVYKLGDVEWISEHPAHRCIDIEV
jgi:hypothetical protein